MQIAIIDDPFDISLLATSIQDSSNFRFAWQFYHVEGLDLRSIGGVAEVLDAIILDSQLHSFLAESLDSIYPRSFEIETLHEHASIVPDPAGFLDTMTRASLDRLGAYSRSHAPATSTERPYINSSRKWAHTRRSPFNLVRIQIAKFAVSTTATCFQTGSSTLPGTTPSL